jgi:anti-sigma B factor antagonist
VDVNLDDCSPFRVVRLSGDVDLHSSPRARQAILEALRAGHAVLVDLSGVSYMDSSGVATLVEGYQLARKSGVEFGLAAAPTSVMNVLRLARLDRVFPIHLSVEERLARG